jgi:glutathione peroxidase
VSLFLTLSLFTTSASAEFRPNSNPQELYNIQLKTIEGKPVKMSDYKGKVLMIVNTASACGFTPQFKDLVDLQNQYGKEGFQVLAFPSNDFKQDTGSNEDVKKFAEEKYKVNFPLFDKAPVRGSDKQPIYKYLVSQRNDILNEVSWNFEKFVVNKKGEVVERYSSRTKPSDPKVVKKIDELLKMK